MAEIDNFLKSLQGETPPTQDPAIAALWWGGKRKWEQAHAIAQDHEGDRRCDRIHAWLHRQEGDLGNARYWYRRSGHAPSTATLEEEWHEMVEAFLMR